ncbi:ATP-binding protein, partial [Candidatus Poribacteria bacterium]|nr:ATP-binding protein [Candidatus Poribacteria bacterium]
MSSYFIESFKIDKLWGNQNIDIPFNKDVNVLIGPNGSGKTTVLTLLHSILSGDLRSVVNFNFQQAKIGLKSFKGNSVRTVKVDIGEEFLKLKVGKKEYEAPIDIFFRRKPVQSLLRDFYERDNVITNLLSEDIDSESTPIVPLIWLPVSRRLPLTENDEERHIRAERLESVDLRLKELLDRLSRYYLILNAQFSERRREFEGQALSTMLYSKERDGFDSMLDSISSAPLPTKSEKTQLLNAFETTGFLDEKMQTQIDDYFTEAGRVLKLISEGKHIRTEDIPVIPIILRTQTKVESARKLENQ